MPPPPPVPAGSDHQLIRSGVETYLERQNSGPPLPHDTGPFPSGPGAHPTTAWKALPSTLPMHRPLVIHVPNNDARNTGQFLFLLMLSPECDFYGHSLFGRNYSCIACPAALGRDICVPAAGTPIRRRRRGPTEPPSLLLRRQESREGRLTGVTQYRHGGLQTSPDRSKGFHGCTKVGWTSDGWQSGVIGPRPWRQRKSL